MQQGIFYGGRSPVFELVAADVHRTSAFKWVRVLYVHKEKEIPIRMDGDSFSGGRYRTRTYDLPHVKRML